MYLRVALFALLLPALPLTGLAQKSPAKTPPAQSQYGIHTDSGAESHGFWRMDSGMRTEHSLKVLQRDLNLTDSQVSRIRELAESRKTQFASIREQARPKFERLMSLLRQPNPDPAEVGRATIELKQVHEQATAKQTALEKDFYNILTDNQRATVDKLRSQGAAVLALHRLGLLAPQWKGGEQAFLFDE
jgi:Spy/CpxP family protein refolding chaperone